MVRPQRLRDVVLTAVGALAASCANWALPISTEDPGAVEGPVLPEDPPNQPSRTTAIYLAGADGSDPQPLVVGARPAWSPDGQRIVFQSGGKIHVVASDGRRDTVLAVGKDPAWSPDSRRIVFVNDDGIAVMGADGSGLTVIRTHDVRDDIWAEGDMGIGKPAWSPDGGLIAFEHLGDGDMVPAQIFLMHADGSEPRRLTATSGIQYAESDPSWSPDGTSLVFWSYGSGITTATVTGDTPPTSLYQNFPAVAYGSKPAWSPDGTTILFTGNRHGAAAPSVWSLRVSDRSVNVLLPDASDAVWSPDGHRVAFVRLADAWSGAAPRPPVARRQGGAQAFLGINPKGGVGAGGGRPRPERP